MIASLNNISLDSSFFADIVYRKEALNNLKDGTIYVFTRNQPEWNDQVVSVQNSISNSRVKALWHLPYNIESMNDFSVLSNDEGLLRYFEYEANLLMPLYTPDRVYKCYLVGNVENPSYLKAAFGILTVDAQKIIDECTFASFATTIETNPESAKQLWLKLLDYNSHQLVGGYNISFKGKYNTKTSDYTFLGQEFRKSLKLPKVNYSEFLKTIKAFPDTITNLSKKSDEKIYNEEKMNYVKICNCLSNLEKNELILELSKRINDKKILEDAIDAVLNKGKLSRLKVKIVSKKNVKIEMYDKRITGDWYTCLFDEKSGVMRLLDFEPTAHVIYVMNLIHRLNNPDDLSTIDVRQKEQEFLDIYDIIYSNTYDEDDMGYGQKLYNKLICSEDNKLKSCYKIITNCINEHCAYFNESPSPYITDMYKPLTIEPKLIEIPESFKYHLKSYFM